MLIYVCLSFPSILYALTTSILSRHSILVTKMKAIIAVPVTLAMIYRAHSHKSLTPAGIAAATLTAVAHAVHPWNLPFALLIIFFLAGTAVTKVSHYRYYSRARTDGYRSKRMSRRSLLSNLPAMQEEKALERMFKSLQTLEWPLF